MKQLVAIFATVCVAACRIAAQEKVDLATIERIKAEALERSQVMEIASRLTDVYGPRLTGSPQTKGASDWAVATMQSWGISTARLEKWNPYDGHIGGLQWGPNDRSWSSQYFAFRAVEPQPFTIIAVPSVWSPGTKGRVTGPAIRFEVNSFADMQRRFAGKLKNAFLLMGDPKPTPAHFEPQAHRLTDPELESLAAGHPLNDVSGKYEVVEKRYNAFDDTAARHWLVSQGVSALLFPASGDGGTVLMSGSGNGGPNLKSDTDLPPLVKVSAESYGRIARILEDNILVTLELEMRNTFYDGPDVFNVIAEIPGTDPKIGDEVVMMGAHLDSWTFGTGATDDGAGAAVMMEAMRILKTLNLQPRRTIRVALWTGEEQGALGSGAWVQRHLRDWAGKLEGEASTSKPDYDKFSVYFNLDAGTGKIRGIFQQGNAAVRPIFEAWMTPFNKMGMKTVSILEIGGGDNHSFGRVGLPNFGFIQDPIEYSTRTHHTSADVYERLQPEDLKFNSAVLAAFAWQAVQRDEKLPRMPTGK